MVSTGTESILISDIVDGIGLVVITNKAVASLNYGYWAFSACDVLETSFLVDGGLVTGQGLKTVSSTIVSIHLVTDNGDFLPEHSDFRLLVAGIAVPQDDGCRGGSDGCGIGRKALANRISLWGSHTCSDADSDNGELK